jgi:hypothetical protein
MRQTGSNTTLSSKKGSTTITVPFKTNIIPERYNSISKVSPYSIVSKDLNSVTKPRTINIQIEEMI